MNVIDLQEKQAWAFNTEEGTGAWMCSPFGVQAPHIFCGTYFNPIYLSVLFSGICSKRRWACISKHFALAFLSQMLKYYCVISVLEHVHSFLSTRLIQIRSNLNIVAKDNQSRLAGYKNIPVANG